MLLHEKHCELSEDKKSPLLLSAEKINLHLKEIPEWTLNSDNKNINRRFSFKDYHQTLLFINNIASIIHKENHHPNINFSYNNCTIKYSTHSASGITLFDFICAAKIEKLFSTKKYK